MPDDTPWTDPVVVPDDLRELQAEIDAYHREVKQAARRRRVQRITRTRAWRRFGVPLSVVLAGLALAGMVFTVLTFGHTAAPGPAPQPLAATAGSVGEVGGLLPDVTVAGTRSQQSVRTLRPALLALVPLRCGCTTQLGELAAQAGEARVPLVVVAPAAQDAEVAALPGQLHRGPVRVFFDAAASLADTYDASGVTTLVVAPDGTVTYLERDVPPGHHLELPLLQMATTTE